ncbi:hypothetical protein HMPREF1531_02337 [Propionibacterium sp. oral taxon 192 str. F0372]|uniref:magnesium chelatase subunit ChlI family protein n=1 Tax=Propionibacterium sp. oral taxon 192 TaxID=671222 RepID=UPI0003528348|nr:hypothetical protein [Propionibacterium sp. oral taxon 192]EPH00229.1 hypothetical protein HMPREF1531_02337 [Propionibacterium sp. oral taxon 192 str. F0372]
MIAARVLEARERQAGRLRNALWRTNGEVSGPWLRSQLPYRKDPSPLEWALNRGLLSARGVDKVLRLAWTVADLAGEDRISAASLRVAMQLRQGVQEGLRDRYCETQGPNGPCALQVAADPRLAHLVETHGAQEVWETIQRQGGTISLGRRAQGVDPEKLEATSTRSGAGFPFPRTNSGRTVSQILRCVSCPSSALKGQRSGSSASVDSLLP